MTFGKCDANNNRAITFDTDIKNTENVSAYHVTGSRPFDSSVQNYSETPETPPQGDVWDIPTICLNHLR